VSDEQDCEEFLAVILDALHEDLKVHDSAVKIGLFIFSCKRGGLFFLELTVQESDAMAIEYPNSPNISAFFGELA